MPDIYSDQYPTLSKEALEVLEQMQNLSIQEIQKIGSNIQHQLSENVDTITQKTMTIDCDEAGKTLVALTTATDIKMLAPHNALISKLINPVKQTTRHYKSIEKNLITLSDNIYTAKDTLEKNLSDIEVLLAASQTHFNHLSPYIEAMEVKINELEEVKAKKLTESNGEESLEVLQVSRVIDAYKRRQKDLGVSKIVAYQTVKECMLLNNNNHALTERMQYAIDNLIPLYKQQLIAAVAVRIQKDSTKIIKSMSTAVSNLMVDTAKNISSNMDAIKEINESPILDVNKLKEVEVALNHLLEDMKNQNQINKDKHLQFMKNVEQLTEGGLKLIPTEINVEGEGKVLEEVGLNNGKE